MIGRDRTGTGKTLAFALPVFQKLRPILKLDKSRKLPKFLVLDPTRELVLQTTTEMKSIMHTNDEFKILSIYGGTEIRQQQYDLRYGSDVIVGTPGRIMDLVDRGNLNFSELQVICLDEADQMLNMGF